MRISLADWCQKNGKENLLQEWNQTNTRTPADYSYGSSQIVGWTCSSCGFTWQDSINHRTNLKNPRGCPKCGRKNAAEKLSRKNLIIGKTDIATLFPELIKEWDYENNSFLPTEVTAASDKEAYWICPQGHRYSMHVVRRTKGGQGCPFCASKRVLRGFNDLLSKRPEIAKEWDSEKNEKTPDAVTVSSNMKAWWRCSRGHFYQTSVYERTRLDGKATSCPYCTNKKVLIGYNDLSTTYPKIADQWDLNKNIKKPTDVTAGSGYIAWWICEKGHSYRSRVADRTSNNYGCPYCAHKAVLPGFNDLETTHPELISEWDWEKNTVLPSKVIAGSHKHYWWKCKKCGYSWKTSVKERAYHGTNCPNCTFYLKTSTPEQIIYFYVKQAFPDAINSFKPLYLDGQEIDIYIPSQKTGIEFDGAFWHQNQARDKQKADVLKTKGIRLIRIRESTLPKIDDGTEVIETAPVKDDYNVLTEPIKDLMNLIKPNSVPVVRIREDLPTIRTSIEKNLNTKSLAATGAEYLSEWNYEKNQGLSPESLSPGSHAKVWWRCSRCEREWEQSVKTKSKTGMYCGHCNKSIANQKKIKEKIESGEIIPVSNYPLLMKEWNFEINADDPYYTAKGSDKKEHWICSVCGNRFEMVVKNRTLQNQGCPVCGKKKSALSRSKKA